MFREMRELFEAEIAEHEENLDEADPRCLIIIWSSLNLMVTMPVT